MSKGGTERSKPYLVSSLNSESLVKERQIPNEYDSGKSS